VTVKLLPHIPRGVGHRAYANPFVDLPKGLPTNLKIVPNNTTNTHSAAIK